MQHAMFSTRLRTRFIKRKSHFLHTLKYVRTGDSMQAKTPQKYEQNYINLKQDEKNK